MFWLHSCEALQLSISHIRSMELTERPKGCKSWALFPISILCWGWGLIFFQLITIPKRDRCRMKLILVSWPWQWCCLDIKRPSYLYFTAAAAPHPYGCWRRRGLANNRMEACCISTLSPGRWDAQTFCVMVPPWHESKYHLSWQWWTQSITQMNQSQQLLDGQHALTTCKYYWCQKPPPKSLAPHGSCC